MLLPLLSCSHISRRFARTRALEEINLEIKDGEIFGLLGPNGAGKTTLIRCFLKLITPDSGEILLRDKTLAEADIQKDIGFLPENFQPPQDLSARELLEIMAWGLALPPGRIHTCLKQVGLLEQKNKPARAYSRGMVQRLGLALALLKEPRILILDEPALGLDPLGQHQMLALLLELNKEGKTIFFSSHILSQIEKACGRVGIIHQGRVRFTGSVEEITAKHRCSSLEEAFLKEIACRDNENRTVLQCEQLPR